MSYTVVKEITQPAYDGAGTLAWTPGQQVSTDTVLPPEVRWKYVFTAWDPEPNA